jgi:hypothetical protein
MSSRVDWDAALYAPGRWLVTSRAAQRTAEKARARYWLTTYGHLSWNRPFYERAGFRPVPMEQWGGDITQEIVFQRRVLPAPNERIAMRKHVSART